MQVNHRVGRLSNTGFIGYTKQESQYESSVARVWRRGAVARGRTPVNSSRLAAGV